MLKGDKDYHQRLCIFLWLSMLPLLLYRPINAECNQPVEKPKYLGVGTEDLLVSPELDYFDDCVVVVKGENAEELSSAVSILLNGLDNIDCSKSNYCVINKVECTLRGFMSCGNLYINDSVLYKSCDTGESVALDFNGGKYTLYLYCGVWEDYTTDGYELCECKVILDPTTLVSQEYREGFVPELNTEGYHLVNYFSLQGIHEPPKDFYIQSVDFSESFEFMVYNNSTNSLVSLGRKNQENK